MSKKICFLELYAYIRPIDSFCFKDFYTNSFFNNLINLFNNPIPLCDEIDFFKSNVSLNNFYSSSNSYILRQISNEIGPNELGLVIEIYENGHMKLLLPLPQFSNPTFLRSIHDDSIYLKQFEDIIGDIQFLRIIDGHGLLFSFVNLFNQYINLLKKNEFNYILKIRMRLTNIWRSIIYFNSENYMKFLQEYALPICIKDQIEIPPFFKGQGLLIDINEHSGLNLMSRIYEALGIPTDFVLQSNDGICDYILKHFKEESLSKDFE